jgi:hypothetical protein
MPIEGCGLRDMLITRRRCRPAMEDMFRQIRNEIRRAIVKNARGATLNANISAITRLGQNSLSQDTNLTRTEERRERMTVRLQIDSWTVFTGKLANFFYIVNA